MRSVCNRKSRYKQKMDLGEQIAKLGDEDVLMITADHGCDPGYTISTDHSREYTPFVMYGPDITPMNMGTRESFADIAATTLKLLGVEGDIEGEYMV